MLCINCQSQPIARVQRCGACYAYRRRHQGRERPPVIAAIGRVGLSAAERFWSKVDKSPGYGPRGDCWAWKADKICKYGELRVDGKHIGAHRVSWELHNGAIPDGLWVLHECDNAKCVNPGHLFLGTHADNMNDMASKGRADKPIGERNPQAKLTTEQVLAIRARWPGARQRKLAAEFGVSQSTINSIVRGRKWAHI